MQAPIASLQWTKHRCLHLHQVDCIRDYAPISGLYIGACIQLSSTPQHNLVQYPSTWTNPQHGLSILQHPSYTLSRGPQHGLSILQHPSMWTLPRLLVSLVHYPSTWTKHKFLEISFTRSCPVPLNMDTT